MPAALEPAVDFQDVTPAGVEFGFAQMQKPASAPEPKAYQQATHDEDHDEHTPRSGMTVADGRLKQTRCEEGDHEQYDERPIRQDPADQTGDASDR